MTGLCNWGGLINVGVVVVNNYCNVNQIALAYELYIKTRHWK